MGYKAWLLKKEKPDQRLEDCKGLSPVEASATLGRTTLRVILQPELQCGVP